MREIKFRAWDKRHNRFIVLEKIHFGENGPKGVYERNELSPTTPYIYSIEWIELMAYTGLKDQNGREIYEGDILSLGNNVIAKVYYADDLAMFRCVIEGTEEFDLFAFNQEASIVGNIYENKELLDE